MDDDTLERWTDGIAGVLADARFDTSDRDVFAEVQEPVELSGQSFKLFVYRPLLTFPMDPGAEAEVLWTMVVLCPPASLRDQFLGEVTKQRSGLEFDESVIGEYYARFHPSMPDTADLLTALAGTLVDMYSTPRRFLPLGIFTLPTFDMAAVFIARPPASP